MPDHVHFFCAAEHDAKTLAEFVRLWKQWTTKGIKAVESGIAGPRLASAATAARAVVADIRRVWQREFFEHGLRSEESYAEKWEYVRQNPVRAGLAVSAEEWAFQGGDSSVVAAGAKPSRGQRPRLQRKEGVYARRCNHQLPIGAR